MNHSEEVKRYIADRAAIAGAAGKGECKRRGDAGYYAELGRKGAEAKKAQRRRSCDTCGDFHTNCFGWPHDGPCPKWVKGAS